MTTRRSFLQMVASVAAVVTTGVAGSGCAPGAGRFKSGEIIGGIHIPAGEEMAAKTALNKVLSAHPEMTDRERAKIHGMVARATNPDLDKQFSMPAGTVRTDFDGLGMEFKQTGDAAYTGPNKSYDELPNSSKAKLKGGENGQKYYFFVLYVSERHDVDSASGVAQRTASASMNGNLDQKVYIDRNGHVTRDPRQATMLAIGKDRLAEAA